MGLYGKCKECGKDLNIYYQEWSGLCNTCIDRVPKDWSILNKLDRHLMSRNELKILEAKGEAMRLGISISDVLKLKGD